jgi:tetratricopeptide (TPR) repeat protein
VVVVRPRVAVFGWVCSCRPGLVPPAASEVLADQFASYCRGSYEVIDRGEVCWYMGRLGLTMREVLNDPASRRCLAQALNARYFVFGSLRETASFDVETHLVDPETGTRTGTGKIHVKDQDELKLRLGELARQIGARPDEQKAMAAKAASTEKALREARSLLTTDPARAAQVARVGLKDNPDSTALQALVADADRRARAAKLEADRRAEAARQAKALEEAKKRQADLAKQAAEAKAKAEAEAKARGEGQRKAQQAQRERAAASLRAQARQAMAKGNHAQAVQQLQSAANLQPGEEVYKELAAAKVAAEKATADRALAEQKKRDEDARAKREAAAKQVQAEKERRDKAEADRRKGEEARARALHDGLLKQANAEMAKKEYAKALASAESARRFQATPEAAKLAGDARQQLALANAKNAAERKAIEEDRAGRDAAEKKLAADREQYTAAMKKAQDALVAKKYPEAAAQYAAALKLFDTDAAAKTGLKTANDLLAQEKKREADEKAAKEAAAKRAAMLKDKLDEGKKLRDAKQYARAVAAYQEAVKLAPANVEAQAGLEAARREAEKARADAAKAPPPDAKMKDRREAYLKEMAEARAAVKGRKFGEAIRSFDEALKLQPGDPVATKERAAAVTEGAYAAHMARGAQALTRKQPAEARKAFEEALKLKPNDPAATKGVKDATPAPAIKDPKGPAPGKAKPLKEDYDLAMGAGAAAMKKLDYKGAVNAYTEALNKIPGDKAATAALAGARYGAAMAQAAALMKQKKFDDAVKAYDEALKAKPGDAAAIKGKKEADAAAKKR